MGGTLEVTPDDVARYTPGEEDLKILKSLILQGATTDLAKISAHSGVEECAVEDFFSTPVRAAWCASVLRVMSQNLLGLADFAMLQKAMNGDVPAYKALSQRFGHMVNRVQVASFSASLGDMRDYSDDDLSKLVDENMRKLGMRKEDEEKVIDVQESGED